MKLLPLYRVFSITAATLAATLTPSLILANQIQGVVVDNNGQPLNSGTVQIMGSNKRVKISKKGEFIFTGIADGVFELHVSSPRYIHSSEKIAIVDQKAQTIRIEVDEASIEVIDVTASAFHSSNIESAAPVSVLAGEKLKQQQASTLGETLKNQVGVHSSFYGGVSSSPIIRGLDGPRVLITQNGMDAADVSRVGPDHLVSAESSTVQQIEVLRGPATLFYGSGAIGGVVNLVDNRIPSNNESEGEASIARNSNNSEESFSGLYKTGSDNIAIQIQGFYRDNDDYRIPGAAESESAHDEHDDEEDHEEEGSYGVVENTAARTKGVTVGASYLFDSGDIGFSLEHMSSVYGVPGHAHAEEEHEDEEHDEEEHAEEIVKADLQQNRYQMAGKFQLSSPIVNAVNFGVSYTDYQHSELENGVVGTTFESELFETRVEVLHQPIQGWRGGLSVHSKLSDFSATGEEAFTPPSDTNSFGIGLIEERHFGDWLVQLGARIETVSIDVNDVIVPEIEFESAHDEEEHDEEHEESSFDAVSYDFTPISISAGVVWDIAKGYNVAASYVHARRAPSAAELFSFGPHVGTQTYEIGALYNLHAEEDGHNEVEFSASKPSLETSNNIDLSWRKFGGDFGAVVNIFYNQVDDYYYSADTGLEAAFAHEHDEEELEDGIEEEAEAEELLPVFIYTAADAELYGAEVQFTWQASSELTLTAQGDYIRAKIKHSDEQNLPRIPPVKVLLGADYKTNNMSLSAQVTHMFEQTDVAEYESSTDAYTLLDVNASYFTLVKDIETEWYLRGRNLTDEEARVHTSFLKDLAPLPGRSVELGLRFQF